jgi:hypothetical protein
LKSLLISVPLTNGEIRDKSVGIWRI